MSDTQKPEVNEKIGTDAGEYLEGTEGADKIEGLGGGDHIQGKGGDDTLIGGDSDQGVDTLEGGLGDDTLIGGAGVDHLHGDNVGANSSEDGKDTLVGGGGDDRLKGGGGDDVLEGGADKDTLWGEGGDDTLAGGLGDGDQMTGGTGSDTFVFDASSDGNDFITDFSLEDGFEFSNLPPGGDWVTDEVGWMGDEGGIGSTKISFVDENDDVVPDNSLTLRGVVYDRAELEGSVKVLGPEGDDQDAEGELDGQTLPPVDDSGDETNYSETSEYQTDEGEWDGSSDQTETAADDSGTYPMPGQSESDYSETSAYQTDEGEWDGSSDFEGEVTVAGELTVNDDGSGSWMSSDGSQSGSWDADGNGTFSSPQGDGEMTVTPDAEGGISFIDSMGANGSFAPDGTVTLQISGDDNDSSGEDSGVEDAMAGAFGDSGESEEYTSMDASDEAFEHAETEMANAETDSAPGDSDSPFGEESADDFTDASGEDEELPKPEDTA